MKTIALVTGVAGGIGYATAEKLLAANFAVVGMDIAPELPRSLNGDFLYVAGDLSKSADRERFVKTAISSFGKIDILVNVAGVAPRIRADLLRMTEESYDFVMNINTKGTLFLTQLVANEMIKTKSGQKAIVNISSMSAYTSSVTRGEYCISKAGVSMITALFADRLAEYGIAVNEIRPGIIATGMTEKVKEKYNALIDGGLLPIKRWGTPDDVACAVLALVNGSLPYVTGQSIDVDGGFHIQRL
ncbi:MAG: 3-ketoacyl-ACP reductase [Candidatus Borkfalkiaceae bacterium]|nr:3-ketoacyl-ACP reductase [Clostridia bacterium]MDY6222763.1 3-ketoacyl-ACP reductase [Christensenellaceae bacterium]